jgi:hypothetical protein
VEEGLARYGWWRPSVAGVMLVSGLYRSCRGHAAFDKASVGGFSSSSPARTSGDEDASRLLPQSALRLKPASSAGCRSDPWTLAGRWLCPWPTQIVIPTTLAPETGEVSWDSMGLRWVLFLAEVDSHPSKSQDLSSGWKVVDLEVKSWRILPAVSGRTGSKPSRGCSTAVSQRLAPQNLNLSKSRPTLLLA